jgi:hypothetical protein
LVVVLRVQFADGANRPEPVRDLKSGRRSRRFSWFLRFDLAQPACVGYQIG